MSARRPEYILAVHVALGDGAARWIFSASTSKEDATREGHRLRATGHPVQVLTYIEAQALKRSERREEERERRRAAARAAFYAGRSHA